MACAGQLLLLVLGACAGQLLLVLGACAGQLLLVLGACAGQLLLVLGAWHPLSGLQQAGRGRLITQQAGAGSLGQQATSKAGHVDCIAGSALAPTRASSAHASTSVANQCTPQQCCLQSQQCCLQSPAASCMATLMP